MRVALVTSSNAAGMSDDDPIMMAALERAGHQAVMWRWDDETVDWSQVDVAPIRSTWDYFERAAEFTRWLQETRGQVRFINDAKILLWNLDKHYLRELCGAGVPVLPTQIAELPQLEQAVESVWQTGQSAIVKPVISGGSWGLHHLQAGQEIKPDPDQGPWLVQPFVPSIETEGELSVILLGGQVSHGIRKFPSAGDIRVQREHGGREAVETPSVQACEIALQVQGACPGEPVYARVDVVQREGRLELMEVELLEPELFFVLVPEAADRLAALVL